MMLRNYPAISMYCTARYLIISTIINFSQILKCYRACLFNEHAHMECAHALQGILWRPTKCLHDI